MKVEVAVLGLPIPNSPYGLCGRKATFEKDPISTGSWFGLVVWTYIHLLVISFMCFLRAS